MEFQWFFISVNTWEWLEDSSRLWSIRSRLMSGPWMSKCWACTSAQSDDCHPEANLESNQLQVWWHSNVYNWIQVLRHSNVHSNVHTKWHSWLQVWWHADKPTQLQVCWHTYGHTNVQHLAPSLGRPMWTPDSKSVGHTQQHTKLQVLLHTEEQKWHQEEIARQDERAFDLCEIVLSFKKCLLQRSEWWCVWKWLCSQVKMFPRTSCVKTRKSRENFPIMINPTTHKNDEEDAEEDVKNKEETERWYDLQWWWCVRLWCKLCWFLLQSFWWQHAWWIKNFLERKSWQAAVWGSDTSRPQSPFKTYLLSLWEMFRNGTLDVTPASATLRSQTIPHG